MDRNFITVVSGLPRSGTSLMMQMLAAGGVPALTDAVRAPDENNPRGYLEFEKVKQLRTDQSWLEEARGHAVKIIHLLLRELPINGRFQYRVLFLRRPMEEILASQRAMLAREGKTSADTGVLTKVYQSQLDQVEKWLTQHSCFATQSIEYHRILDEPSKVAEEINTFVDGNLNTTAMEAAVDRTLYRQRASTGAP